MARFIRVYFSTYDADGFPVIPGDDRWLNIDHIVHIEEHLGNNLFRRFQLGETAPEQFYPCLLITTTDRRERLISLGITATAEEATAALETALKEIITGHLESTPDQQDQVDGAVEEVPPF